MENQTQPIPKQSKQSRYSKIKPALLIALALIGTAGICTGIYFWQHNTVNVLNSKVGRLQTQLKAAGQSQVPSTTKGQSIVTDTFTYSPKTGGMSLTLSKAYGVVVSVDGNKGGAPGATFRVASATNSNVFSDPAYQGVQVDIDNTFKTLAQAIDSEESALTGEGGGVDRNYRVSDTTVAGLPAKLLKADGLDEYQGDLAIYLVGSGSFLYTITTNGAQNSTSTILTAVLKGMTIKPVTL